MVKEYFDNGDVAEVAPVCQAIEDGSPAAGGDIVALIVRAGLDNNNPERELACTLISGLCARKVLLDRDIIA